MEMKKEKFKQFNKEEMADILLHYIYVAQQDEINLTLEEQGQIKQCQAKDFYKIINIDVMDIDEDNEDFISCEYINSTIILKYHNRIIKIAK